MELALVGIVNNEPLRLPLREGVQRVGRGEDVEIRLPVPSVSRRHAEIRLEGGRVIVRDLGSHNGTKVNGEPVSTDVDLDVGDQLGFAELSFRLQSADPVEMTQFSGSATLVPSEEISWEEMNRDRSVRRDRRSRLFRVLAEAGELLTNPREPELIYEPILDLVETAMEPERIFVLLQDEGGEEPVVVASRLRGGGQAGDLALSRTMVRRVLRDKASILTTDPVNDPDFDVAMSMVAGSIRSAMASPLFVNEEVIGLIYADDTRQGKSFSRDELRAFTMLGGTIAMAISHARYHAIEEENLRRDADLRAAGDILEHILPGPLPDLPGYELASCLVPCFEVGGDLYDFQTLADGRFAFFLGDVSGKGLGAAMLVSHLISLARFMTAEGWEPERMMRRLNEQIFRCTDFSRFATAILGHLDPADGGVVIANAGHNKPLIVRADGSLETCEAAGLPVGMMETAEYGTCGTTLAPGDLLVMYSDGVTETMDESEELFGDERFEQLLVRERGRGLDEIVAAVQADLAAFRGGAPVSDDVSLLMIRREG